MKVRKKTYAPPVSICTQVVLESPICANSEYGAGQVKELDVTTTDQEVNSAFRGNNDFSTGSWDSPVGS